MADRIKNYSLGSQGVVLDPHHLLPGVSPEGLTLAQNATHDMNAGFLGAIRKRPGFARFNAEFAGGPILGGIMMPIAATGGAPAAGGGAEIGTGDVADGTSTGSGNMIGAPGGTFDGGAVATVPAGAAAFTGGTTQFAGARLILIGADDNAGGNDGGHAWYASSKGFADVAIKTTTPLAPCTVYSYPTFRAPYPNGLQGQPSCIGMDGRLYYAAAHGNQATGGTVNGVCPIYVTNGGTAALLANIPGPLDAADILAEGANPPGDNSVRAAITSIHAGTDGFLYVTVKKKYTGQDTAGSRGRVYRVRPTTGDVVEWNMGTASPSPASYTNIPYCCNYFAGYLFVGEANNVDAANGNVIATNGTGGIPEISFLGASGNANNITCFCQFNGRLFMGTGASRAAGATLALLTSRPPTGGVGNSVLWTAATFDIARTGNTTNGNSYVSMVVYDATTAFLSWHAPSTRSIIYKVVANAPGDSSSTSFTFTSVFDSGAGATAPLNLYVDQGVIYAISSADSGAAAVAWVSSDGGASWVDRSAKFGNFASSTFAIPIFYAINQ